MIIRGRTRVAEQVTNAGSRLTSFNTEVLLRDGCEQIEVNLLPRIVRLFFFALKEGYHRLGNFVDPGRLLRFVGIDWFNGPQIALDRVLHSYSLPVPYETARGQH